MMVHVGFGHYLNTTEIVAILSPDTGPVRRRMKPALASGHAHLLTQGRRTKAVILTRNGLLFLSALNPETIEGRIRTNNNHARPDPSG